MCFWPKSLGYRLLAIISEMPALNQELPEGTWSPTMHFVSGIIRGRPLMPRPTHSLTVLKRQLKFNKFKVQENPCFILLALRYSLNCVLIQHLLSNFLGQILHQAWRK